MDFKIDSTQLIGKVNKHYQNLKHKGWEWHSFYNGWIEGRAELAKEIREGKFDERSKSNCIKPAVSQRSELLLDFINWNNENHSDYIPNSRIGRYLQEKIKQ